MSALRNASSRESTAAPVRRVLFAPSHHDTIAETYHDDDWDSEAPAYQRDPSSIPFASRQQRPPRYDAPHSVTETNRNAASATRPRSRYLRLPGRLSCLRIGGQARRRAEEVAEEARRLEEAMDDIPPYQQHTNGSRSRHADRERNALPSQVYPLMLHCLNSSRELLPAYRSTVTLVLPHAPPPYKRKALVRKIRSWWQKRTAEPPQRETVGDLASVRSLCRDCAGYGCRECGHESRLMQVFSIMLSGFGAGWAGMHGQHISI
ncbi:uncharacterized protein EV422DRAFT_517189 [Fimicolochytrium jonesii]|uniref:uncharacterized protein n=1 Tax=Fimicolochytrium jonesii TaxID=1396493 RepID=UPI0022FEB9CE|nr:uncharacterized protein EV422DRAFT_517189 [Fimicolochytrium jonesii]KAI8825033.1 hypothetical protein EV422DRAFT_517189 [Fimicolochytrium jonesii]